MNEHDLHAANLAYINNLPIREAYNAIVYRLSEVGLRISVLETSSPKPVRIYAMARWDELSNEAAASFTETRVQGDRRLSSFETPLKRRTSSIV